MHEIITKMCFGKNVSYDCTNYIYLQGTMLNSMNASYLYVFSSNDDDWEFYSYVAHGSFFTYVLLAFSHVSKKRRVQNIYYFFRLPIFSLSFNVLTMNSNYLKDNVYTTIKRKSRISQ